MKITIVTVCYNAANCIEDTILSVIKQTYTNTEYIIIDGNSTDGTIDIIKKYEEKITKWISETDNGIYDAMNKGIMMATGDYINFMNAGDKFYDNSVLENIFKNNYELSNYGVIYGCWTLKYRKTLRKQKTFPFYMQNTKFRGMGFSHQSSFVNTELAKKYPFDTNFKLAADYNMIYNLFYKDHVNFLKTDYNVCIMEETKGATSNNYELHIAEVCRICGMKKGLRTTVFIKYKILKNNMARLIKYIIMK